MEGWPVPSYGVVRAIVGALDPGMVTLALEGPGSYRDKYELALRRQAERPNAMWQAGVPQLVGKRIRGFRWTSAGKCPSRPR